MAERSPREQGAGGVQETGDIRGGEVGEKYYLNYVPINLNALAGGGGSAGKGWRFDEGAKILVNLVKNLPLEAKYQIKDKRCTYL